MANTPYIDLVKPAGTDKALISVLNANSDKIDSAVGGVQDALAIVCNGNTHGAITSGQFVYVRAHDTLQEGLYTANSNIAANATLSSSNLTANSSGGLNALNEQIAYTAITSGSMNSYTGNIGHTLYYKGSDISQFTDIPSATSGNAWPFVLEVIKMGPYAKQILHVFTTPTKMNNPPTFIRQQTYQSGSIVWGGWYSVDDQIALLPITGVIEDIVQLTTSGAYSSEYTVPENGWYTVCVNIGSTAGNVLARIAVGNAVILNAFASLNAYDRHIPSPLFIKKGTKIKGMAVFPTGATAHIQKIS